jgi:hypothetical protein
MIEKLIEMLRGPEETDHNTIVRREWDRVAAGCITPAEKAEIDAIFARALI